VQNAVSLQFLAVVLGIALIIAVLWDALEMIILPRTVARRFGLSSLFIELIWKFFRLTGNKLSSKSPWRERLLGAFGPVSLLILIAVWAWLLIFSYALLAWGFGVELTGGGDNSFPVHMYASAVTFFTVGYGDVTTTTAIGRTLSVIEASMGFGFLALVIGYIPVLYGSFSRREATILLLDARAGSPPTAGELLKRYDAHGIDALEELLSELERWCANLLESYLSYPTLALYRSQHEKMSWLGALTMIMDSCSLLKVSCDSQKPEHNRLMRQAELTYALARHVIVDLAYVFNEPPVKPAQDRLPVEEWQRLVGSIKGSGMWFCVEEEAYAKLKGLRKEYEPYVNAVSLALFLPLPPWMPMDGDKDSWQIAAWDEGHF
jgi:hypothetical protein